MFYFILLMGLIVCLSIAIAVFLLRSTLLRHFPDDTASLDKGDVTAVSEHSLINPSVFAPPVVKQDGEGQMKLLDASVTLVKRDEVEQRRAPDAGMAAPISSACVWQPQKRQPPLILPQQTIAYPHSSSRSPYASAFNQLQKNSAVTEFKYIVSYERGIQIYYDEKIAAFCIVFIDCSLRNMQDIHSFFPMIHKDSLAVLKKQGLEKVGILVDLAGLDVAGEITPVWGDEVKKHVDEYCRRFADGNYHLSMYFSRPVKDEQEYIRRKKMEILSQTEAVRHQYQSNLFPTKEEAIAYFQHLGNECRR